MWQAANRGSSTMARAGPPMKATWQLDGNVKTIGDALTRYAFEIKDEKERKGIFEVYNALDDAQLPQNHP